MSELIAIREAARRLGVSDTAVRKAISSGRVKVAGQNEKNGRPLLSWPECEVDWRQNSDATKRTHVGPTGTSARRASYASDMPIAAVQTERDRQPPSGDEPVEGDDIKIGNNLTLNEAKTITEIFKARQAKLDYEEAMERLIPADTVKVQAFKVARQVRDGLMNIPDRVAAELAAETNPAQVHQRLYREIRDVLSALSSLPA